MNSEERSSLFDLIECAGYPVLINLIEELVKLEEKKVLTYDLKSGDAEGLVFSKCEATGARKLALSLQSHLKSLRVAALKADVKH